MEILAHGCISARELMPGTHLATPSEKVISRIIGIDDVSCVPFGLQSRSKFNPARRWMDEAYSWTRETARWSSAEAATAAVAVIKSGPCLV